MQLTPVVSSDYLAKLSPVGMILSAILFPSYRAQLQFSLHKSTCYSHLFWVGRRLSVSRRGSD